MTSNNVGLGQSISADIEATLNTRVRQTMPVSGGDINAAYRLDLADGRQVFVKTNPAAPTGMFEAEARGLDWLRVPNTVRIPTVLLVGREYLVLEWIDSGSGGANFDERLGQQLAQLHRQSPAQFGLDHDNFIGSLPQANPPTTKFSAFFAEARLLPQFERARRAGHFDSADGDRFARLVSRLELYLGPEEPPAKLHGDLWSGNVLAGRDGQPWLIDPAAYAGHREIDLAMLRLFGGVTERVFDAYNEAYPLTPDYAQRVPLMQLYPLLVHVNLFGASYAPGVRRTLALYAG